MGIFTSFEIQYLIVNMLRKRSRTTCKYDQLGDLVIRYVKLGIKGNIRNELKADIKRALNNLKSKYFIEEYRSKNKRIKLTDYFLNKQPTDFLNNLKIEHDINEKVTQYNQTIITKRKIDLEKPTNGIKDIDDLYRNDNSENNQPELPDEISDKESFKKVTEFHQMFLKEEVSDFQDRDSVIYNKDNDLPELPDEIFDEEPFEEDSINEKQSLDDREIINRYFGDKDTEILNEEAPQRLNIFSKLNFIGSLLNNILSDVKLSESFGIINYKIADWHYDITGEVQEIENGNFIFIKCQILKDINTDIISDIMAYCGDNDISATLFTSNYKHTNCLCLKKKIPTQLNDVMIDNLVRDFLQDVHKISQRLNSYE